MPNVYEFINKDVPDVFLKRNKRMVELNNSLAIEKLGLVDDFTTLGYNKRDYEKTFTHPNSTMKEKKSRR